jgi:hypothetical protein
LLLLLLERGGAAAEENRPPPPLPLFTLDEIFFSAAGFCVDDAWCCDVVAATVLKTLFFLLSPDF